MSTVVTDNETSAAPRPQSGQRRVLESLTMRARTTGDKAAARSRLVRRLRIALPVTGLLLVAIFFFSTNSKTGEDARLEDFEDLSAIAEELRMSSPRFSGVDDGGKPFEITASAAIQKPNVKDLVELENPRAVQGEASDTNIVTARSGLYRSDEKILELSDEVTLEHQVGEEVYIFRSPAATVLIDDQIVTSDAGVGGEGPKGETLQADRIKAYHGEGRVVLQGNVRMRIYPKSKPSPQQASDDGPPPLKEGDANQPE